MNSWRLGIFGGREDMFLEVTFLKCDFKNKNRTMKYLLYKQ